MEHQLHNDPPKRDEYRSPRNSEAPGLQRLHGPEGRSLYSRNSIGASGVDDSITMTPTTQFLEQPVLLNVGKRPPPHGSKTAGRGHGAAPPLDDLLVDLQYASPPLVWTCVAALAAFAFGAGLHSVGVSDEVQLWIGALGYFFISALECLTLPLIFTSVTMGVANLVMSRKTRGVHVRMCVYILGAALLACSLALGVSMAFAGASGFARKPDPAPQETAARFKLLCPNGQYLNLKTTSSIGDTTTTTQCGGKQLRDAMQFVAFNITGVPLEVTGAPDTTTTFAQHVVAVVDTLVTQNIMESFAASAFLATTLFSALFGAGLVLAHDPSTGLPNHAFMLIKQIDVVLALILNWLLPFTPLGTFSAVTFYVLQSDLTRDMMRETLSLTLALLSALFAYVAVVGVVAFLALGRRSPLPFVTHLLPALLFMLGSANYTAAIPIVVRCLERSREVSRSLAQYTASVGISLCLPGTAAFSVVATVFMAFASGNEHVLTPLRLLALVCISALSSIGVPHEAGASVTAVATIWRTVFAAPLPPAFALVVAVEWLSTRLRRTCNVLLVALIARVIAEQLDETVEDEDDRVVADRPIGLAHL